MFDPAIAVDGVGELVAREIEVSGSDQRQDLHFLVCPDQIAEVGEDRILALALDLEHGVGKAVDEVGVIAEAAFQCVAVQPAIQRIVALAAGERVLAVVAGDLVGAVGASTVDILVAEQREILKIGERSEADIVDIRRDRVRSATCQLGDDVLVEITSGIGKEVGVVASASNQGVLAKTALEPVIAYAAVQLVVAEVANDIVVKSVADSVKGSALELQIFEIGAEREAGDGRTTKSLP